jgi:hypothetical protein
MPADFPARFDGWCVSCDEPFRAGEIIRASVEGGYEHRSCQFHETRVDAPVCETCFLEKPCPCEDDQ